MSAERLAELLGHMALSEKLATSYVEGMIDTDLNAVWETVQTSVPELVQQLAGIQPA